MFNNFISTLKRKIKTTMRIYREQGLFAVAKHSACVVGLSTPAQDSAHIAEAPEINEYAEWVIKYDALSDSSRQIIKQKIAELESLPIISIIMPTYNSNLEWLTEAIESVRKQLYPHWELCIADDASTLENVRPVLEEFARSDSRIKVVYRSENGHISEASNSALALATGEWIALFDHDDLLAESALYWVVDAINRYQNARLIYSDEDKINESGVRSKPYFKCDWNKDLFYSHNLITHLGIYRMVEVQKIRGFRTGFEGAQDYDLALRFIECIRPDQIVHIPRILYHWREHAQSTAKTLDSKPYAMLAGERALNEHLARTSTNARAELIGGHSFRVRYALPPVLPKVSLIIPSKNAVHLLRICVESILRKTTYSNYEIIIVDNGSDDAKSLKYLETILHDSRVIVIHEPGEFNYSYLNNAASKVATGAVIGLLNNDIEVIAPEWLSEMVSHALRPEVGAVGARLWYPNETIQHAGVILGLDGGIAGHAHRNLPKGHPGYVSRAWSISSFSAVTGACLVVRKELFERFGGLDEIHLKVALNDVDFCLRLVQAGFKNVWTPYAELYHHESASRGYDHLTPEKLERNLMEIECFVDRWGEFLTSDPAYSPNLSLEGSGFTFAFPPRV